MLYHSIADPRLNLSDLFPPVVLDDEIGDGTR